MRSCSLVLIGSLLIYSVFYRVQHKMRHAPNNYSTAVTYIPTLSILKIALSKEDAVFSCILIIYRIDMSFLHQFKIF